MIDTLTVFRCWKSKTVPFLLRRCIESEGKLNGPIASEFADDAQCAAEVERALPELLPELKRGVFLADIWRVAKLWQAGGVYADLDIEWIQPLGALLAAAREAGILQPETEILLTTDHPIHERLHHGGQRIFMNDFIVAVRPGAELFRRYLDKVRKLTPADFGQHRHNPVHLTGPGFLTAIIEEAGGPEELRVGVLPWQWVHALPDMTLWFPEWGHYDALIRSGQWMSKVDPEPFVAHHWWHSYLTRHNMLAIYGELLFQSDGTIADRRLRGLGEQLDAGAATMGVALAEFAEAGCGAIVEVGHDAIFRELASTVLQGLPVEYHRVQAPAAIDGASEDACRRLKDGHRSQPEHGAGFLAQWPGQAGLIYMACDAPGKEAIAAQAEAARMIVDRGLVMPGGLVLLDTDHAHQSDDHTTGSAHPRAILEASGFRLMDEGRQLLLEAPAAPPAHGVIPRIIHQTWCDRRIEPPFQQRWADSWIDANAGGGWEYRFWTDEDLDRFVAEEYPDFYDVYCDYDAQIKRVDAARYLILKRIGGVYADLDTVCLRPLDELLDGQSLLFGCQRPMRFHPLEWHDAVCNAVMASSPNHPFWTGIEHDLGRAAGRDVLEATGPDFLTARTKDAVRFLPRSALPSLCKREVFYPFDWTDPARIGAADLSREELAARFPNSYALTFWTATWKV